jgi:polysaccharide export outer membrane protein
MTTAQAARAIESKFREAHVVLKPNVTVFVEEYATEGVTVLGEVRTPGTYVLFGSHSLYDALAAAGGPTQAEGATIAISHQGDPSHHIDIPVKSPNFSAVQHSTQVLPGDTVFVSRAPMVYVVGDVARPGAYYMPVGEKIKAMNLVALASGVNPTASAKRASIVRPTPEGGAVVMAIDLKKIMNGHASDVSLLPSDVLVIPRSGVKVFFQMALPGATSAVTSAVSTALIVR